MTFLTRFVDAASKLTNHDGHDILDLESRDNDASGPALEEGSVEEENQVWTSGGSITITSNRVIEYFDIFTP